MPRRFNSKAPEADRLTVIIEHMAAAVIPAPLTQVEIDAMQTRILESIAGEAPPGTFTLRAANMQWLNAGHGVEVKVLRMDHERHDQTVLIRMQPGSVVVGHRHTQEEECFVLEGEVFIGKHCLRTGDMHVARPGVVHEPIRAPAGALLLIRSETPPRHFSITGQSPV